jgi:hypothetical protein
MQQSNVAAEHVVEGSGIAGSTLATLGEIDWDKNLAKRHKEPPHKLYTGSRGYGTIRSDFSEVERDFPPGVHSRLP